MPPDTFDEILGLEEQFYDDGYRQGLKDGNKAGLVEGRTFGLEKGFEKYVESGRLYGKSLVWANRIPQAGDPASLTVQVQHEPASGNIFQTIDHQKPSPARLPSLPHNQRLAKHVKVLHALSELETLSTENSEEAVSDFDDRLQRAQGKAKIIERAFREASGDSDGLNSRPRTI
jgi:hypothetical protein